MTIDKQIIALLQAHFEATHQAIKSVNVDWIDTTSVGSAPKSIVCAIHVEYRAPRGGA